MMIDIRISLNSTTKQTKVTGCLLSIKSLSLLAYSKVESTKYIAEMTEIIFSGAVTVEADLVK